MSSTGTYPQKIVGGGTGIPFQPGTAVFDEDAIYENQNLIIKLLEELRRGLDQASYFKKFKRGQIVFSFDKNGSYSGMIVTLKD